MTILDRFTKELPDKVNPWGIPCGCPSIYGIEQNSPCDEMETMDWPVPEHILEEHAQCYRCWMRENDWSNK